MMTKTDLIRDVVERSRKKGRGWICYEDLGVPVRCLIDGKSPGKVVRANVMRGIAEVAVLNSDGGFMFDARGTKIRTRRVRGNIKLEPVCL